MKRVTLNGIKRMGLENWKGREQWAGRRVRIWSNEHGAWWRMMAQGYSRSEDQAGIWRSR